MGNVPSYLVDIFEQLNKLNLQIQKWNINIIKLIDSLKAFISKLENWKRKVTTKMLQCLRNCHQFLLLVVMMTKCLQNLQKRNFAAFDTTGKWIQLIFS